MTDHLQAAKDLMGLVDELTGGPVDPEKAMFAAQTHAMIAIAESLRSGTIERTETVTHYQQAAELPASMTDPRRVAALRDAWLAACAEHAAEAIRRGRA